MQMGDEFIEWDVSSNFPKVEGWLTSDLHSRYEPRGTEAT
jgi:hypothetical protein